MKNISVLLLFVVLLSCTPEKSPIEYGHDKCHYCKMAIVDKKFGAELVTQKSKVYKFDATECLVNFIHTDEVEKDEIALLYTNTYDNPGELVEIDKCYFLRSEDMPSPMGMFINPFAEKQLAMEYQSDKNGNIYEWEELKSKMSKGF